MSERPIIEAAPYITGDEGGMPISIRPMTELQRRASWTPHARESDHPHSGFEAFERWMTHTLGRMTAASFAAVWDEMGVLERIDLYALFGLALGDCPTPPPDPI